MTAYEEMIRTIRAEARRGAGRNPLMLGEVSENGCDVGDMEIDAEDIRVNEAIRDELEEGDEVLVAQISDSIYIIIAKVVGM